MARLVCLGVSILLLSLSINLRELEGKSVLQEAIELAESDAEKARNEEVSFQDEDPLLEEIDVDNEIGPVEVDSPRRTQVAVWNEKIPILESDAKAPREVVITSLERSDFEHLTDDQFEKLKETELLLKEEEEDPIEDGLRYVDLDKMSSMEFDEDFHPAPMPKEFQEYDINKDGKISLEELIETTGAMENVDMAFDATDKDGDGHLNEEEFSEAPWLGMMSEEVYDDSYEDEGWLEDIALDQQIGA